MRYLRLLALLGICVVPASYAHAQRVVVGVGIGPTYVGPRYVRQAPVCAYGYYPYAPYACAPYGYYGPSWFSGGVFIGAGPWSRGIRPRPYYGPVWREPRYIERREAIRRGLDRDRFRGDFRERHEDRGLHRGWR